MFKTRILALSACALLSVGCSGIGDGSKLETIRIVQSPTQPNTAATEVDAFTCVRSSLTVVGEFTRGDIGNFSNRVVWSSDNEAVLRVTNVNEPVGDDSDDVFLIGGVLLPQMASDMPVTISAEYLGLRAEVQVTVKEATEVRIEPAIARILPNTTQRYVVRAKLDGVDTDVTSLNTLSFVEANDEVALLDTTTVGVVRGVAVDPDPLFLQADPGVPCPALETVESQAQAIVADAVGDLVLDFEEGFESGQLAEGTSQFLQLRALFGDFVDDNGNAVPDGDQDDEGEFQDLSNQFGVNFGYDADGDNLCELRLEDTAVGDAPLLFNTSLTGVLSGLSLITADLDEVPGNVTTKICADFGGSNATTGTDPQPAMNGVLSNTRDLTVIDAPLVSLALSASDPCDPDVGTCEPLDDQRDLTLPGISVKSGDLLRIDAVGTFDFFDGMGIAYTQNVNKNANFSSSEPLLANVVTGGSRNAGVVVTTPDLDSVEACEGEPSCPVTITVTWTFGTSDTTDDVVETIDVMIERADDDTLPE